MSQPTQDQIVEALRNVKDTQSYQDIVGLKAITDLEVRADGAVRVQLMLPPHLAETQDKIENQVKFAVKQVPGVTHVFVTHAPAKHAGASSKPQGQQKQAPAQGPIPGVKQIIAVSSGKGGVGKSTVAVNLATALSLDGYRVGLMDADVYGPNTPTMMGVIGQPRIVDDPEKGEVFLPPDARGIKVMSMGMLVDGDQPMIWRGPMLHNVIQQFCHRTDWGNLDYLVVDMPPGTGDVQLSLAQLVPVDGTVLVTTPQEVALQDVRKAFLMWEKVKVPVLGIVENMSTFVCDHCSTPHELFGSGGGESLAKKFDSRLLAQLPLHPRVRLGGDEGTPVVAADPDGEAARQFRGLAQTLVQELVKPVGKGPTATGIEIGSFT